MRPLLLAIQFLTRLPLPSVQGSPRDMGRSLPYYPLVGLLIGGLLLGLATLLAHLPPMTLAALLLVFWVLITGGLHLDGLADSADAWLGGYGDRERSLAIMKDPRCGPAGVIALVLVLLLKFAALHGLLAGQNLAPLLIAPLLGRGVLPLLFLTTPYVRRGGLGQALSEQLPRKTAWLALAVTFAGLAWLAPRDAGLSLAASVPVFLWLRRLMMKRLGGTTGDTAGALTELTETAILLAPLVLN